MEKTCANHPESLALATCKACEKSICLMCVCDEKEGTFCSPKCISVFREVSDWVDPGTTPVPATAAPAPASQSTGSIFDPDPAPSAPAAAEMTPPPSAEPAEFEPLVTPGTKWRMIGSVCALHQDTQAVATCEGCERTLCALCVVEAENGTFCAECASKKAPPAPLPMTAAARTVSAPRAPAPAPPPSRTSRSRSGSGSGLKIVAAIVIIAAIGGGTFYFLNSSDHPVVRPDPNVNPNSDPKNTTAKTDPSKTDPAKIDPAKVVPAKTDPDKTDPAKSDPSKVSPIRKPPAKKPDPPPKPKPPGVILNPWALTNPGAWYRVQISSAGKESYSDLVLRAKDADSYTLETSGGEAKTVIAPFWVKGEESLTIDGRKWLCEVREWENPPVKRWVLIESKNAGAVLKEESAQSQVTTTRLWEHTTKIGRRSFDCLVIEGTANGQPVKRWYSALFPTGEVRIEAGDSISMFVDLGDDATKRPPIPK
jgi:hypothetical protein